MCGKSKTPSPHLSTCADAVQQSHRARPQVCFYPGLLALGALHGAAEHPARDLETARRLARTCTDMSPPPRRGGG